MWTSARGIVRAVSVGLGATLPYGTMRRIQPAGRYRKSKTATGTRAARLSGRSLHERLRIWWTVSPTGCWLWNGATTQPAGDAHYRSHWSARAYLRGVWPRHAASILSVRVAPVRHG